MLLGNVFLSSTKPYAAFGGGSSNGNGSEPEVRRPLSFFAPDVRFVAGGNPADAAGQLKALIKALHGAGLEVLLEVRTLCVCVCLYVDVVEQGMGTRGGCTR